MFSPRVEVWIRPEQEKEVIIKQERVFTTMVVLFETVRFKTINYNILCIEEDKIM